MSQPNAATDAESAYALVDMAWYDVGVRYAASRLSSVEDGEDGVQTVLLKLWLNESSWEDRGHSREPWLWLASRRLVIDRIRSASVGAPSMVWMREHRRRRTLNMIPLRS
jgi:DNA-directed RNA polymerase specialized sigma24 family protein